MTGFDGALRELIQSPKVARMAEYTQHGDTSCLLHCVAVAVYSQRLGRALGLRLREEALARGALLHDYFLYDWHHSGRPGLVHAFGHPYFALENARRDFALSAVEENIIVRHMFPMVPIPPRYKEGWLVTAVDKALSVYETFKKNAYGPLRRTYLGARENSGVAL